MAIRKPTHAGLYPQEEKEAGVLPFPQRRPSPYPRSAAAYGMARGGTVKFKRGQTVLEGYEYEGEGIVAAVNKGSTTSKKSRKTNPIFQKKVAAVNKGSTPSKKARKKNPILKKAARGGKVK